MVAVQHDYFVRLYLWRLFCGSNISHDQFGTGKLPRLSDEEREQRRANHEVYLWECQQRDEQRRLEYQQEQAASAEAAEREAAIAATEANRKARQLRADEISRQTRERELRDLRLRVTQQGWWQAQVQTAIEQRRQLEYRQTLMGELENMLAPPPPPPEPEREIVYVEEKDPTKLDWPELKRWF